MRQLTAVVLLMAGGLAACGGESPERPIAQSAAGATGPTLAIQETTISATFEATGIAEPVERATLSTRLMGSVTEVLVQEGDRVRAGQVLARIDAREVEAKRAQVEAGIAAAEALYADAATQAGRFRALYADSAATLFQLDQVETGLARAEAGLRTARAARSELDAVGAYATITAPFAGVVTLRHVDPGAMAAPGSPVVEVQDDRRLRIGVTVPPSVAQRLKPGMTIAAVVEGASVPAVIEGVVPAPGGGVYTVNAMIPNPTGAFLPGSSATLAIPTGTRSAILVPAGALVREGDLVGVRMRSAAGTELRWVRVAGLPPLTAPEPRLVEVIAGLRAGDVILSGGN